MDWIYGYQLVSTRGWLGTGGGTLPARLKSAIGRKLARPRSSGGILISYRRSDEPAFAGRLYDRLRQAFGENRLFMDVDNIPVGSDFVEHLESQLGQCEALLVIMGKEWRGVVGEDGKYPIEAEDDFVSIQVAAALEAGKK